MTDNNNILLITDDQDTAQWVLSKLVLLRTNDKITVSTHKNAKKVLENSLYSVVILHEDSGQIESTIRSISSLKEAKSDIEIILLLNEINPELI
ncbi:hypothetical protein HDR58_00020, partial [bacterium]|nr:hypothetical protein [bacterium]